MSGITKLETFLPCTGLAQAILRSPLNILEQESNISIKGLGLL